MLVSLLMIGRLVSIMSPSPRPAPPLFEQTDKPASVYPTPGWNHLCKFLTFHIVFSSLHMHDSPLLQCYIGSLS